MAPKIFQNITRCLAISTALLYGITTRACGWGDDAETLRLALFRAQTDGMAKFSPFFYTQKYFNESGVSGIKDKWRNCGEWQQKLGSSVTLEDIYKLQYETEPEAFQLAVQNNTLATVFKGNTFIKSLLLPKNKALLDYFTFAKQLEFYYSGMDSRYESWEDAGPRDYWDYNSVDREEGVKEALLAGARKKLEQATDKFLQQRYAYMLVRYGNPKDVVTLYDRYFGTGNNSILEAWVLLFKAYVTEDKAEQNYYLSRCFDLCDDKVLAAMQWFNLRDVEGALKYAKNNHERAVILAMDAMRNPGRALQGIEKVNGLLPGSNYVELLIAREINKLEDWVFFHKMNGNAPDIYSDFLSEEYIKARTDNFNSDMAYLHELKGYLEKIYPKANGGSKDYLASCLAHLSFMADDIADGYKYANAISSNAPESIKAQKAVELALVTAKQGKLNDTKVQQQLYEVINQLYVLNQKDFSYSKNLYTLLRLLSAEYNKAGDMATAGLLFLKAENFKSTADGLGWGEEQETPNYGHIGYFDRCATLKDMDNLIALVASKSKTPFQKFICQGTTSYDINLYLDLQGTIAFRQNNLELAYNIFSKIPDSYYKKGYLTAGYFNEDPYYPWVLDYALTKSERDKKYDFNKARFVKQLMELSAKSDAESYLKLGHAYYNLSYAGSYWGMVSYYQGSVYYTVNFGDMQKQKEAFQSGNYAKLTLAKSWYTKAYKTAKNKEQKAMAALMLHVCERVSDFTEHYYWGTKPRNWVPDNWVVAFYRDFKGTNTFKKFSCPEMEMYLK